MQGRIMDTVPSAITVATLASQIGSRHAPVVIDVRREEAFAADPVMIAGALRRAHDQVAAWRTGLPDSADIVVYCAHGREVSQGVVQAMRAAGYKATFLTGGVEAWKAVGAPTMNKLRDPDIPSPAASRWVTRERPKIDRIACPWLITRFVDPLAEFLYVPSDMVLEAAERELATPYDVPGVRFTHRGEHCSFDAMIQDFGINDAALTDLAAIVRGADTGNLLLTPQSAGLLAVSLGLSAIFPDDHTMLKHGMTVYDALYAWLRTARTEIHNAALFGKQS
jgi:rhodanese-related sulfurtransferase